jgi:hypothetical protein
MPRKIGRLNQLEMSGEMKRHGDASIRRITCTKKSFGGLADVTRARSPSLYRIEVD